MSMVLINRPIESTKRITTAGTEIWELPDGNWHREDGGPAITRMSGHKAWYNNDERHREDGPAVIRSDGSVDWWLRDTRYTFNEYCNELKRKYGKTEEDIMMIRMQYEV